MTEREAPAETAAPGALLPVATGRGVGAYLWRTLPGKRWRFAGILALFLVEAGAALVFPLVTGAVVDTVLAAAGMGVPTAFWGLIALLLAAAVAAGILAWVGGVLLARMVETVVADLREDYVAAALALPRADIERAGTGDVVTRASEDIAQISQSLPDALPRVAVSAFTILLVAAGLGTLNPWYLAGFALTVPLYAGTVRWYLRVAPAVYAAERVAQSRRGQQILGTLNALPAVTAHRLEQRQLGRIRAAAWETVRRAMRARIVQNRLFGRLNLTEAIGLGAVLGIGVWLAFSGSATPGEVTAAALLFLRTVAPIAALLFVMDDLQSALAALGRLVGVINRAPAEDGAAEAAGQPGQPGQAEPLPEGVLVRVADASFGYEDGAPVLVGVSLSLRVGETLAVVGATGSGKSTLAALIAGVYRPGAGLVQRGVGEERIVTVAQEAHVFAATLRENLTLAAPAASDDVLRTALSRAGAEQAAAALPEGLDTPVGHGGHPLEAALAQHLALARVELADPAVVILDEATADAGAADATALERAAAEVTGPRAALVIAHRLSQAAGADRIIVLDEGRVIEVGDHASLLRAGGSYARLWAAWAAGGGHATGER